MPTTHRPAAQVHYLSLEDEVVDHAEYQVEPDAVKHQQRTQQTIVHVVDVSHSDDHVTLEQRAAYDPVDTYTPTQ